MKERIQKVIAREGVYSRRAVESLIAEGKIKVNGIVVTQMGLRVDARRDRIQIAGKAFRPMVNDHPLVPLVLMMNKPRRVMVTRTDPQKRTTVYDFLPAKWHHLKPAGRLDYLSQGVLVMTNDGRLIQRITHPARHVSKVYEVKVSAHPGEKQLKHLRRGLILAGERLVAEDVAVIRKNRSSAVLQFGLRQGKNRQIRKMCEAVGLTVKDIKRVAIGALRLKSLRSGQWRLLQKDEVKKLFSEAKSRHTKSHQSLDSSKSGIYHFAHEKNLRSGHPGSEISAQNRKQRRTREADSRARE